MKQRVSAHASQYGYTSRGTKQPTAAEATVYHTEMCSLCTCLSVHVRFLPTPTALPSLL